MTKIIPVALFFLSFFASLVSNAILRTYSKRKQILLDRPDKYRKFHKNPTPLTGGLGISIGIIFSAIFLLFFMGSTYKLEFSNQVEDLNNMNQGQPYELKLDNGVKVIIKKYDNDSFTMLLPSGETLLYTVSPNSEITQLPSIKINDQNNVIQLNNFSIGLILSLIHI